MRTAAATGRSRLHGAVSLVFNILLATTLPSKTISKSTIEPCSNSDSCSALVGYTLYTDLKVSEVASLFNIDPISLLTANSIDISYPDVENHILPSNLFLKIPITCSCIDGIRKSTSTSYKTRPSDTLAVIADSIYRGLVSADQIKEANGNSISDPSVLSVGTKLLIPLPCTCFNGSDNNLPAVYMSYVVTPVDTLAGIASMYFTTVTDLMNVNALGSPAIKEGDILAIPLSACSSSFPKYASDYGLSVPNGSYAITASHCVQCSCGLGSHNLYCMPASLAVSCSSMQCRNSNLMLGNIIMQQTSGGCNVTTCNYGGFVNGTIITTLSTSLQPRCPASPSLGSSKCAMSGVHLVDFVVHSTYHPCVECTTKSTKYTPIYAHLEEPSQVQGLERLQSHGPQQFPPLIAPPVSVDRDSLFAPAPSPAESSGAPTIPKSSVVPSSGSIGIPPANGPTGSITGSSSAACSLVNKLASFPITLFLALYLKYVSPLPL